MQTLESIVTVSFQKIFSFYGYQLRSHNESFFTYRKDSSTNTFYLFNEPEKDLMSLFSLAEFQCITKAEFFVAVSGKQSLSEIIAVIPEIERAPFVSTDLMLSKKITTDTLIAMIMSLNKLQFEDAAWYSTPQFSERIFSAASSSTFRIPLCIYNDRKFVRFINMLEWNKDYVKFLNNRTEGFFTSNLLDSTRKLFVTPDPNTWQVEALSSTAPEYLFFICHPMSSITTFQTIQQLYKQHAFSELMFSYGQNPENVKFTLRAISYFLNYENEEFNCQFDFNVDRFQVFIDVHEDSKLIHSLSAFISQSELKFTEEFYSGLKNEYVVSGNTIRQQKIQVKRINKRKQCLYYLSFDFREGKVISFLNRLCNQFLSEVSIKIKN